MDALGGQPGVYSARFAGPNATDDENNEKLTGMLRDVAKEERQARFVSVLALAIPDGQTLLAKGTCEGIIVLDAKGERGLATIRISSCRTSSRRWPNSPRKKKTG